MAPKYRRDIDGLRAVAVLSVLVYHLNKSWLPGGFVGVDIFFVISGFLITRIIVSEIEGGSFSFSRFYARRVRRIFPALFAMLFVSGFFAWAMLPVAEYRSFFQDLKMAGAQISNFHFAREVEYLGIGIDASPLLHTWSLAVEEQFYLVWPLLCLGCISLSQKRGLQIFMAIGFILSLIASEFLLRIDEPEQAFYMFYSRAFQLIAGGILTLGLFPVLNSNLLRHGISIIGAFLIAVSFIVITPASHFPGVTALLPTLGSALLLYSGQQERHGLVNKVLALSPLVWIGLISYSLYLWHWPVIIFVQSYTAAALTVSQAIMVSAGSFLLAYLSFRFIEKPFRKTRPDTKTKAFWTGNRKTVASGLGLILVTILVGQQFRTQPEHLGRGYKNEMLEQARGNQGPSTLRCSGREELEENADLDAFLDCVFKSDPTGPDVIQIGDSHSMYLKSATKKWAKNNGFSFQDFGISACPMLVADYRISNGKNAAKQKTVCSRLATTLTDRLSAASNKERIFIVVNRNDLALLPGASRKISLLNEAGQSAGNFEKQLELYKRTITNLTKAPGNKVVLIGQPTVLAASPFECLDREAVIPFYSVFSDGSSCTKEIIPTAYQAEVDRFNNALQTLAQKSENVEYFGIADHLPSLYDEQGRLLYKDLHHINRFGAETLVPALQKTLPFKKKAKLTSQ